jgi:hypothetical protein
MKKVDCYSDPAICINPVCELTSLRKYVSRRTYGCTPVTTIDKLKVHTMNSKTLFYYYHDCIDTLKTSTISVSNHRSDRIFEYAFEYAFEDLSNDLSQKKNICTFS